MPATPQRTSTPQSGIPADVYAPGFEIQVENQKLGAQSLGNISEVKVEMALEGPAHFELVLDNWDDTQGDFKNIESATRKSPPLFDLGNRVFIKMGYAGRLVPMVRGTVTSLAPQFPESGPRTLTVSGLDAMFRLMHRDETLPYKKQADWQIAAQIAQRQGLAARLTKMGPEYAVLSQQAEDDVQFLLGRAKRKDFDFHVAMDPATGDETLVFAQSQSSDTSRAPVYVLEWGKGLISFSPMLDVSNQVSEVRVRDSNPDDKQKAFDIVANADDLQAPQGGRSGPALIAKLMGTRPHLVERVPVLSPEDTRNLALSELRRRAYDYSKGSGKAAGVPDLRPGDNVEIRGVGPRYGGNYQVSRVEHLIDPAGYITSFSVRRPWDGGSDA